MIEFFTPKKIRFIGTVTSSVAMVFATHCVSCESASAQGLLNRIRARIDARMTLPPPPPVLPANPYGYRAPAAVPYFNQPGLPQRPRVLATPTPQQYRAPEQNVAPTTGYNETAEPTFGVEVAPVGFGPNRGLEVRGFRPNSPLPDSGIVPGDVIVAIDGRRTDSMGAMLSARRQISPGDIPTMQIVRDGQLYQVRLPAWPADDLAGSRAEAITRAESERTSTSPRFAAKPPLEKSPIDNSSLEDPSIMSSPIEAPQYRLAQQAKSRSQDVPVVPTPARPRASLGISARDASPQRGVIVAAVNDGSAAKMAGIEVDDRIVAAAGRLIRDKDGLIREFALSKPGDSVTLGIVRGEAMRDVVVEMGGPDGKLPRAASDVTNSTGPSPNSTNGQPAQEAASNSANSLFSGVGSALGNFFGGAPAQPMDSVENTDGETVEQADEVFELPAPAAVPDSESNDPLALPEDE